MQVPTPSSIAHAVGDAMGDIHMGDLFIVTIEHLSWYTLASANQAFGALRPTRMRMPGFTFAQNPYSLGQAVPRTRPAFVSEAEATIDLIDLNPYFHGVTRRIGAPFWLGSGLP